MLYSLAKNTDILPCFEILDSKQNHEKKQYWSYSVQNLKVIKLLLHGRGSKLKGVVWHLFPKNLMVRHPGDCITCRIRINKFGTNFQNGATSWWLHYMEHLNQKVWRHFFKKPKWCQITVTVLYGDFDFF